MRLSFREEMLLLLLLLLSLMAMTEKLAHGESTPFEVYCTTTARGNVEYDEFPIVYDGEHPVILEINAGIMEDLKKGFCLIGPLTDEEIKREAIRAVGLAEPPFYIPDGLRGVSATPEVAPNSYDVTPSGGTAK